MSSPLFSGLSAFSSSNELLLLPDCSSFLPGSSIETSPFLSAISVLSMMSGPTLSLDVSSSAICQDGMLGGESDTGRAGNERLGKMIS